MAPHTAAVGWQCQKRAVRIRSTHPAPASRPAAPVAVPVPVATPGAHLLLAEAVDEPQVARSLKTATSPPMVIWLPQISSSIQFTISRILASASCSPSSPPLMRFWVVHRFALLSSALAQLDIVCYTVRTRVHDDRRTERREATHQPGSEAEEEYVNPERRASHCYKFLCIHGLPPHDVVFSGR